MTNRQGVDFGHQLAKCEGGDNPIHTLPGNLLASTHEHLSQGGWTGQQAAALRRLSKIEILALGHLLKNKVALRTSLEGYLGANFFAPGNKRIIHVGPVITDDIYVWPVNRQGISLEDFSSRASFQMKDLELASIDSGTSRDLSYVIEPESLVRLVPYSAMHALWLDAMDHEVDNSGVLVELVKRTGEKNKPIKRIFCAQKVLVGSARGYFCIEDMVCITRKVESSGTMEGDYLLTWK